MYIFNRNSGEKYSGGRKIEILLELKSRRIIR